MRTSGAQIDALASMDFAHDPDRDMLTDTDPDRADYRNSKK